MENGENRSNRFALENPLISLLELQSLMSDLSGFKCIPAESPGVLFPVEGILAEYDGDRSSRCM
jgi:hypothetical protein